MQPGDNRNLVETCSSGTDWLQNMDDRLSCFQTIQDPKACPKFFLEYDRFHLGGLGEGLRDRRR